MKVTTVLLVYLPGSTSSSFTPSTLFISFVICSILVVSLPSLKLGTHSTSFIIGFHSFFTVSPEQTPIGFITFAFS